MVFDWVLVRNDAEVVTHLEFCETVASAKQMRGLASGAEGCHATYAA